MDATAVANYGMMAAMRRLEASAQATVRGGDYAQEIISGCAKHLNCRNILAHADLNTV